MSGSPPIDGLPPDEDWLAAEYALGLAEGASREEAERRLAEDPAFADEVASWQARLAPLDAAVEAVPAPLHLWPRIAAALPSGAVHSGSPVAARAGRAATGRPGLWHSLAFWRWVSAGSLGAAAACLVALGVGPDRPAPPLVATLAPADGRPSLSALVERGGRSLVILPASLDADTRVPELWLIPPGGGEPISLGVIQAGRTTRIVLPAALAPHARPSAGLAVSLEPSGGSPTGRPTGPVVAHGALAEL